MVEAEHLVRYWWAAQLAPGRRVLDAGCGAGYGSEILHKAGPASLTGIDIAESVVDAIRDALPESVTLDTGDVRSLPYPDKSFDLVVCFEVIEHIDEQQAVVEELARVLTDDGILAISSPNPAKYPAGNPHHVKELTAAELDGLLKPLLPSVTFWRQHQWLASAVLDDASAAQTNLEELDCRFAKAAGFAPGEEVYTVVVAAREPIDDSLIATTVSTGTVDFDRWVKLWHEQDDVLRGQYEHFQKIAKETEELSHLRAQLRRSEASLQATTEELAELRSRLPSPVRKSVAAARHRLGTAKHKILSRIR